MASAAPRHLSSAHRFSCSWPIGLPIGLQIVGRIMRVHPAVRPTHGQDDMLDRGYVFLTDPDLQAGLDAAATELKAVRSSIEAISDELTVTEFSNAGPHLSGAAHQVVAVGNPPADGTEREQRLAALAEAGLVDAAALHTRPEAEQDRAILQGEFRQTLGAMPLFGGLADGPAPPPTSKRGHKVIPLRTGLGIPAALRREVLPGPEQWNGNIITATARALFRQAVTPSRYLLTRKGKAQVSLRDLFLGGDIESRDLNVRMSDARIAETAQASFAFNDHLDPRRFKQALIEEFARRCDDEGIEYDQKDLRRARDLFAMNRPGALAAALREAQAAHVRVTDAEPVPPLQVDADAVLYTARLGSHGVFPPNMNTEERSFAEWLDADRTGRVQWWLRL